MQVDLELEAQLVAGAWATECTFLYINAFLYNIIIYFFFCGLSITKKVVVEFVGDPHAGRGLQVR